MVSKEVSGKCRNTADLDAHGALDGRYSAVSPYAHAETNIDVSARALPW